MDLPAELLELQHRELSPEDYDVPNGLSDVPKLANKMPLVLFNTLPIVEEPLGSDRTCTVCCFPSAEPIW